MNVKTPANGSRRDILKSSFGVAGLGVLLGTIAARAGAAKDGVTRSPEKGSASPATFQKTGNFDLSDPYDLNLARLKTIASLDGSKTYFYTITRHILCPPGQSPYPLFAEMELTRLYFDRTPGMAEHQAIARATFTRTALDPTTFKPIESYYNPYLDRTITPEDTLFGGRGFKLDFSADAPPNPITQPDEPHYRIGDDQIAFILFDPRAGEGDWQPRVDTVVWRTSYKALMDPRSASIEADHTYTAFLRASAYRWSGIDEDDKAQMLTMKTGAKVTKLEDLPQEAHAYLVSKYPERM